MLAVINLTYLAVETLTFFCMLLDPNPFKSKTFKQTNKKREDKYIV